MIENELVNILSSVPIHIWNDIIKQEPEWIYFKDLNDLYRINAFALIVLTAGLNAYRIRGNAEKTYFPEIAKHLNNLKHRDDYFAIKRTFLNFYKKELAYKSKIKRLNKFYDSELAKYLWNIDDINEISKNFKDIWYKLSKTMNSKPRQKTIVFAMKCLGISLIMNGIYEFDFDDIPIPVDSRIKSFVKNLGIDFKNDEDIIAFFDIVLKSLKQNIPNLTMIHLDSLLWQIGKLDKENMRIYFANLNLEDIGNRFVNILSA